MKPLKLGSILVLIAIALLLSATTNVSAQSSNPGPTINHGVSTQGRATGGAKQASPAEIRSSPIANEAPSSTQTEERGQGNPQTPSSKPTPSANVAVESALVDYTWWLVIVGGLQVGAILLQAVFLYRTLWITQKVANAAKDSANVARLALQTNRPLIVVSEVRMAIYDDGLTFVPTVTFYNYGGTPAIITDVFLGLERVNDIQGLKQGDLRNHQRHSIQKQVVGRDEDFSDMITWATISPSVLDDLLSKKQTFVAHGTIKYRDVFSFPEPYQSYFCWFYLPPADGSQGTFYIGPKELNLTT